MSPDTENSPMEQGPERSEAYFSNPELVQRTDLLRHLTENSNLIPLVRGVEGSGKSTLIRHLLELAPENWIIAKIQADVMLQPEALLSSLAEIFNLDETGDQAMSSLIMRFEELRQEGFLPVVIVDDAHLLPEASMITLLRLHEKGPDEGPLAQILIFTQPEIESLLKTPQLRVMNLQSLQHLEMPLFTREQTELFLTHFLTRNESFSIEELSSSQIDKIHKETKGMPGQIKQRAEALLNYEENKQKQKQKHKPNSLSGQYFSSRTIIGAGVTLLAVIGLLVFQDSINKLFTGDEQPDEPIRDVAQSPDRTMSLELPKAEEQIETRDTTTGQEPPKFDAIAVSEESKSEEALGDKDISNADKQTAISEQAATAEQNKQQAASDDVSSQEAETTAETEVDAPSLNEVPEPDQAKAEPEKESETPTADRAPAEEPEVDQTTAQLPTDGDKDTSPVVEEKPETKAASDDQSAEDEAKEESPKVKVEVIRSTSEPKPQPESQPESKPEQIAKTEEKPRSQSELDQVGESLTKPEIGKEPEKPVITEESKVQAAPGEDASFKLEPAPVEERSIQVEKKPLPEVKQIKPEATVKKLAQVAPIAVKKALPGASQGLLRERWLLSQKSSAYTIQLVGLQDEKGIKGFISKYSLSGPVSYYRTNRMGKPWYPVLYGSFPDKKSAIAARDSLPENLRNSGVWLRSFASVHKDIKSR